MFEEEVNRAGTDFFVPPRVIGFWVPITSPALFIFKKKL
jgi:hypothetical protein